jgi:hypothetical protein
MRRTSAGRKRRALESKERKRKRKVRRCEVCGASGAQHDAQRPSAAGLPAALGYLPLAAS